jgi:hypothetical protein
MVCHGLNYHVNRNYDEFHRNGSGAQAQIQVYMRVQVWVQMHRGKTIEKLLVLYFVFDPKPQTGLVTCHVKYLCDTQLLTESWLPNLI